ncbi:C39 family peptidase [Candidatus Peregrinibacteria bacterium]|nr:C39 family peptidase [Candidatus Peregrinibacteria bacterium]
MKKVIFIIIGFLFLMSCSPNEADFKSDVPPLNERITTQNNEPLNNPSTTRTPEINLYVPFFSQAPDGDWGMPWQEACEEASVILAYYYATDQSPTKEKFKADIQKLVEWEIENYGQYEHTNIDQTASMLSEVFKFPNFHISTNPTVENLKTELAQGHVIVAPFAGRQLHNPFYSGEGPLYHMLVIKGYDEKNFITNDVGTRRGENFIYPYQVILSAMHEWHDDDIKLGAKKIIVVTP